MTERNQTSRILDEMHATLRGLDNAGLIDKRHMCELDALARIDQQPLASRTEPQIS